MKTTHHAVLVVVAAALLVSAAASAALQRVGPVDTVDFFGYPRWYQDSTGVIFELGIPLSQAEIDGGWVFVEGATFPETFGPPANFSIEHFYWSAGAIIDFVEGGGGTAELVLALESTFANDAVVDGDQVTFGRLRFQLTDAPFTGTYTFVTPYGTFTEDGVAGTRLRVSRDIGIGEPGVFTGALFSDIGPFLLPSLTPGGAELPPVVGPVPGQLYIADPARVGPVTGSPVGQNVFSVTGPLGFSITTNNFSLLGRLFAGAIPGDLTIERANYARSVGGVIKTEVFANAVASIPPRLPGSPQGVPVPPAVSFYDAPPGVDGITGELIAPVGVPEVVMANVGADFWARSFPTALPASITVKDGSGINLLGQIVPIFMNVPLTDQVTVTEAFWEADTLIVSAVSSDALTPPVLTLTGQGPLVAGTITATPVTVPPSEVIVTSAAGGVGTMEVITGLGIPIGGADVFTVLLDTATPLGVLANDTFETLPVVLGLGDTVAVATPPTNGTAVANLDGTITYTPNLGFLGADSFTYTVTINGLISDPTPVTITVVDVIPTVSLEAEDAVLTGGAIVSTAVGGFNGTGFVDFVGPTGESIEWTVNAVQAGLYKLEFRYALGAGNRPLRIDLNGAPVAASTAFPATGSFTTWGTVTTTVTLNLGVNTVRATSVGSSGPNVDSLTVIPVIVVGTFEAEDAVLAGGTVVSAVVAGFTGTGFVDFVGPTGESITWTVNIATAGQYDLTFRYALGAGNRPLSINVNGTPVAASMAFPATGSFTTWGTVTLAAPLNVGANTITATSIGSSGANVDNLSVISQ